MTVDIMTVISSSSHHICDRRRLWRCLAALLAIYLHVLARNVSASVPTTECSVVTEKKRDTNLQKGYII